MAKIDDDLKSLSIQYGVHSDLPMAKIDDDVKILNLIIDFLMLPLDKLNDYFSLLWQMLENNVSALSLRVDRASLEGGRIFSCAEGQYDTKT